MYSVARISNYVPSSIRNECVLIGAIGGGFALGGWAGALGAGATYLLGKKVYRSCQFPRAVQNIYSTIFGSPTTQTAPLHSDIPRRVAAPSAIQKINNDLYIARRIQDADLTFVLSRLTDDNLAVWERLQGKVGPKGSDVTRELWDDQCENWTKDQKRFFTQGIEAGARAFRHTLQMYADSQKKAIRPEIWISYVLSGESIDPSQPMHEGLFPHVEMVLTALTHPDVPVVVHMGIGRTPHNTKSFYNHELPQHKGLSVPLHCFTAKAILETPQGQDKLWMCTRPAWDMAAILDKSLPEGSILKEDGNNRSIIQKEDGSLIIRNRKGQIISTLTKEECIAGKTDLFRHPEMSQPLTEYTIEYQALANSF